MRDKPYKERWLILKLSKFEFNHAYTNLTFLHESLHGFHDIFLKNIFSPLDLNLNLGL